MKRVNSFLNSVRLTECNDVKNMKYEMNWVYEIAFLIKKLIYVNIITIYFVQFRAVESLLPRLTNE